MKTRMVHVVAILAVLAGCEGGPSAPSNSLGSSTLSKKIPERVETSEDSVPLREEVHTVDWFQNHQAERKEVVTKCRNNPGELANMPNCVNAITADNTIKAKARSSLNVKARTDLKLGR